MGYGELLRVELDKSNRARPMVEEIVKAGERAAGLTRQLLASTGLKQVLTRPGRAGTYPRRRNGNGRLRDLIWTEGMQHFQVVLDRMKHIMHNRLVQVRHFLAESLRLIHLVSLVCVGIPGTGVHRCGGCIV